MIHIKKFELELQFCPEYLINNVVWIGIYALQDLKEKELYFDNFKKINCYNPTESSDNWIWFKLSVNPYNIKEMENRIILIIKQIQNIALKSSK